MSLRLAYCICHYQNTTMFSPQRLFLRNLLTTRGFSDDNVTAAVAILNNFSERLNEVLDGLQMLSDHFQTFTNDTIRYLDNNATVVSVCNAL